MYYVIFYNDWCSIVPHTWVNIENEMFHWPPKEMNIRGAIIKMICPSDSWSMHKYRHIIGPYKTYEIARKIEKEAINVSTSDEGQFEALSQMSTIPQKRVIKKPRFYDEIQHSANNNHVTKKPKHVLSPPSNYILDEDTVITTVTKNKMTNTNRMSTSVHPSVSATMNNSDDNDKRQNEFVIQKTNMPTSLSTYVSTPVMSNTYHPTSITLNNMDSVEVNNVPEEDIPLEQESAITIAIDENDFELRSTIDNVQNDVTDRIENNECHCCSACQNARQMQDKIIRKLNLLINLITNPETNQMVTTKESNLLPNFPLSTTEEFLQFEKDLQTDTEIRKQFKSKIAKIGGKSYAGKTRNILKFVLIDTLCQKLSWTGRKGSMAIKDTTFANVITDYLSSAELCTSYDVQKIIQEWLRHAGDRVNYLKKK